jgi:hypothetical protein
MTKSGPKVGTSFLPSFPFNDFSSLPRNAIAMLPKACSKSRSILHNQYRQHPSDIESTVGHVGSHLLEFELFREFLVELLQLSNELTAGFDDGGFGCDITVGVDAELECREEGMRDLVGGECDVVHTVELVAEHVGEGVVFLVESEESGVGDLCA